jgi:hypothetical protein
MLIRPISVSRLSGGLVRFRLFDGFFLSAMKVLVFSLYFIYLDLIQSLMRN